MENLGAIALMWVNMLGITHIVGAVLYAIYITVGFLTGMALNLATKGKEHE